MRPIVLSTNVRRSGFTLIEILIAISLVVVLLSAMFGFMFDMLASRAKALEHVRQQQAATAVINRLEEELLTCVASGGDKGGVRGSDSDIHVQFRSVAAGLATQGTENPDVLGDLQWAEYRFDPSALRVEGRRGSVRGRSLEPTSFSPLEGMVYKLRFRFHDGDEWRESFDSAESGRLPVAVEVAVWLRPLPEQIALGELDAATTRADEPDAEFEGNFDDEAFARISDLESDDLPMPDRLRVIVIPDADDERGTKPPDSADKEGP